MVFANNVQILVIVTHAYKIKKFAVFVKLITFLINKENVKLAQLYLNVQHVVNLKLLVQHAYLIIIQIRLENANYVLVFQNVLIVFKLQKNVIFAR
jgi:hypothetical protein